MYITFSIWFVSNYIFFLFYFQSGVLTPTTTSADNSPPERGVNSKAQLEEMWLESNCKTKLIAL